jgi:hypothetical protein
LEFENQPGKTQTDSKLVSYILNKAQKNLNEFEASSTQSHKIFQSRMQTLAGMKINQNMRTWSQKNIHPLT